MITRIQPGARMSEAVIHGATVYLAGQVGEPGDDVTAQTKTTLAEIDALLAQAGTDKSKILMATIWLADIAGVPKFFELHTPEGEAYLCELKRRKADHIGVQFLERN